MPSNPCASVAFTVTTDDSLAGPDMEWVLADNPDQTDTDTYPLEDWEAIADPTVEGFEQYIDPVTLCVTGVFVWILSHLNNPGQFVTLQIRTMPIDVPKRIKQITH